ncbi:hypothetical protein CEP54_012399 [Fusarium duplospermum]|uniref:Major facilitator superfamily (MFS) profile domain-containing protein n=1 Tax=Fusarium duplospermum TaxID=1325734 RepID=A0A428P980_9HYPO|nr:hypothetical protein CEP54_012399 [Fusarium duplospermum]
MAAIGLLQLPTELTEQICGWIDPGDLLRVRQTCREINERTFHLFAQRFFESRCVMILPESLENLHQISQHPVLSKAVHTLEISTLYFVPPDELQPSLGPQQDDMASWYRTPAVVAYQAYHSAQQTLLKSDVGIPRLTDALKGFTNCTSIGMVNLHTRLPWGFKVLTRRLEICFPTKESVPDYGLEQFINYQHVSQAGEESGPGVVDFILRAVVRLAMNCHVPVRRLNIFSRGDPDSACPGLSEYHSSELLKVNRLDFVLVTSNCTCWAHDGGKAWKDSVKLIAACPELTHLHVSMWHRLRFASLSYIHAPRLETFELQSMECRDADMIDFFRRHRETLRSLSTEQQWRKKAHPNSQTATTPDENAYNNFTVGWEEPPDQDPDNPLNWSTGRKWSIIGILSFITFLTPLASAIMAPGVPLIMAEFETSNDEVATFMVSVFVLGFAFGPLLMAPLSELYGRTPVYHVCNTLFIIFSIGCALSQNIGMLIAFRFLSGFVGVATVTCGSGTIADMVPPEKRGAAMSIWSIGPLLGPVIGPVCAGFLVEARVWGCSDGFLCSILRNTTGINKYRSAMQPAGTPKEIFISAITRPMRMLLFSPIVTMVCVYIATLYGMLYLLFTTFTFVYHDMYGFSAVGAGLSFIAGGVGNLLGLMFVGYLSDKLIRVGQSEGKAVEPEQRLDLRLTVPTALTLPIGLIMYGWTAEKQLHWIVPMIGTSIMGFGMIGIFMISQTYLVDAFTRHAASVTAANAILRSLLGALLPLCGLKLYDALGLGWGNTLLGLLSLTLAPVPWLLNSFGGRIRNNPRFRREF